MNRRWICNDVWMDMFHCFDRPQLGLKLALLSPRFNALVDKHFDGRSELTIWRKIEISSSQTTDGQRIWDVLAREILPIFSANIRHLGFTCGDDLDHLLRLISSTILTDLNQLYSINSIKLFPEAIAFGDDFDGPNSTISAGQILSKWLHSPRKYGQPKQLYCFDYNEQANTNWVNNFKEHFFRANAISSVSYQIRFYVNVTSIVPFELVNKCTKEKLTLAKAKGCDNWIMKRYKIGETAAVYWKDKNCNNVIIRLFSCANCIG